MRNLTLRDPSYMGALSVTPPPLGLSLRFADTKSLIDLVSGQNLITFTRASSATYIDSDGAIKVAAVDVPRINHDPVTGECLGLLIEEQRTNLLVRSEDLTTGWSQYLLSSVAANTTVAPDGQTTADTVAYTANAFADINQPAEYIVNGTTYTLSVWARSVSGTSAFRFKYWNGSAGVYSSAITVTADWQRYSYTFTATATSAGANIGFSNTTAATRSAVFWGAQLEAGAFPTSYIPTTASAATRNADIASITGTNFSSWYRQGEGTVFVNATTNATHGGFNSFPRKLSISDGTNSNSIEDYYRVLAPYTDAGYVAIVAGVNQAQFDTDNQRNGQSSVIGYAANNYAFAVGGIVVNTDLSGTVPTTTQMRLGQRGDGSLALNGTIRRIDYWPQRLPDSMLRALTL